MAETLCRQAADEWVRWTLPPPNPDCRGRSEHANALVASFPWEWRLASRQRKRLCPGTGATREAVSPPGSWESP
eukprot:scaffold7339_cov249-Pinguiococcus_pyrenoidosus.AAC.31